MSALLADTPSPAPEQGAGGPDTPPSSPPAGALPAAGPAAPCARCGQAMAPGQDWCLHCGAAAPGTVGGSGWRPAASILAVTAVLVLGAAAAGIAALGKKSHPAPVLTTTVAAVTPPVATTPTVSTPTTLAPVTPPPKIPLKAITPAPAATTPAATTTTPKTTTTTETAKKEEASTTKTGGAGSEPEPILLDTNAAQTYNPYNYPAAGFGDPSLAIDGDTSTGWIAQVNPASAPRMAEGLLVDLKTSQKISAVKLITSTPGMVVQVYGANGSTIPGSITEKAWVPLSRSLTIKKHQARIGLRNQKKSYRYVVLWISRAPESAVGTAEAPGHVTVEELELFPTG